MMKKKVTGNSEKCADLVLEEIGSITALRYITVFFDNANFLFTNYSVDHDVLFVAEKKDGTEVHATNLNCGYGGNGPTCTNYVLTKLGIDEQTANIAFTSRGFQMEFSDGVVKVRDKVFFQYAKDAVKTPNVFGFDEFSEVNVPLKRITMLNPHTNNIQGLFNAIDVMEPYLYEFFIGKESPLADGYRVSHHTLPQADDKSQIRGLKHVNIIIRGKVFDVYCIVDTNFVGSLVNILHCYLLNRPYFRETIANQSLGLTNKKGFYWFKLFISLFMKGRDIHELVFLTTGATDDD